MSPQELAATQNGNRILIKTAITTYLAQKASKAKKTVQQYTLALNEFQEALGKIKYMDEINEGILRKYKDSLAQKGFAGKTIDTRVNIVYFMLKKNGVLARLPTDEMPAVETEAAVPYSQGELDTLFGGMNAEEDIRYKFFLGSACRDREVTFAAWSDLNFDKSTYTIRSKPEVGFYVKNHESRTVPLPDSLIASLKARRKAVKGRWVFPNAEGAPGNHFLRKLKKIALRAGLNCGQCKTTITKGEYDSKKAVKVTCATDPVCDHFYLHRFRKTCATRWSEAGIPIRTVQHYLGHKSLEVTARYLGVSDSDKVRGKINAAFAMEKK
jgi:integrase